MTLQEIINYCIEHGITDLSKIEVQFNMSDGGPECVIDVSESGLTIKKQGNRLFCIINSY